jgi:hypothetical protein
MFLYKTDPLLERELPDYKDDQSYISSIRVVLEFISSLVWFGLVEINTALTEKQAKLLIRLIWWKFIKALPEKVAKLLIRLIW